MEYVALAHDYCILLTIISVLRGVKGLDANGNEAVYTTTSVACGWAGAVIKLYLLPPRKTKIKKRYRWTDRPAECTRLKNQLIYLHIIWLIFVDERIIK